MRGCAFALPVLWKRKSCGMWTSSYSTRGADQAQQKTPTQQLVHLAILESAPRQLQDIQNLWNEHGQVREKTWIPSPVCFSKHCTKESWAAGKFGAYWDIYFSVRNSGLEKMPSFEWHCFAFGCSCVSRSLLTKTNASIRPSWPLWQKIQSNRGRSSEEEVRYSGDTGNWTEEEERHFASQGRCRTYHLLPQK